MRLEQIYQEVILDHYKHPHHRGLREPFGAEVHHVNPTCGDEVTLRVALSDDGQTVDDISYDGQGCSISQASTSVLTDQVIGQSVGDALKTVAAFSEMVSSRSRNASSRTCSTPVRYGMAPAGTVDAGHDRRDSGSVDLLAGSDAAAVRE